MTEDWKRERLRKTIQQEKRRGDLNFYRVQADKRWWRRKWQAEWPDCRWAQRGYTRTGIRAMVAVRMVHPRIDDAYVRARVMFRWYFSDRPWYTERYDWLGRPL